MNLYLKSILFWFILLVVAIANAVVREAWYKPVLLPYIGHWAHQISSLTGIVLFFVVIYYFIKRFRGEFTYRKVFLVGVLWFFMTVVFETWMNVFIRKLTFGQVLETYYFWNGETWIFVLLSLIVSPLIAYRIVRSKGDMLLK